MPIIQLQGYEVACDTCGTGAPPAFDQGAAQNNAAAASFVSFVIPQGAPRAGTTAWLCPTCTTTVKGS